MALFASPPLIIVATFEERCSREVVIDEEADLHAVCQRAKSRLIFNYFLHPSTCIRGCCFQRRQRLCSRHRAGGVVRDPEKSVQVKFAIVHHVLPSEDPRLCHVHPVGVHVAECICAHTNTSCRPQSGSEGLSVRVYDCHHERRLRAKGHHRADVSLVGAGLGKVRLHHKVAIPKHLQVKPVVVPLPHGDRHMAIAR